MHSETFYKIGGALQFLAAAIFLIYLFTAYGSAPPNRSAGTTWLYLIFLINGSFMNLLIGRSGMPIGQYRTFILINIGTWGLAFLVSISYLPLFFSILNALILLSFVLSIFRKPKFE